MSTASPRGRLLAAALLIALAACTPQPSASGVPVSLSPRSSAASPSASGAQTGSVRPAPGSDSSIYAPNPGAIVVAIDPGHGGCLDWGVPDPEERGVDYSEKVMTLAIGLELRRLLEAQGVTVVMTRQADEALAGDDYPQLGCTGPAWRDVNGDGESGFDPEGAIRTRDELQARLDLANLARADVMVSIHINSLTQNGVVYRIAATQTFYTDETAWGPDVTAPLAQDIQDGVVRSMDDAAAYDRQDRGIQAQNLFIVAPPLLEPTPDRPDPRKQPTRGALMPSVLTEVGSITMRQEQDLLAAPEGQAAAAEGIFDALGTFFEARPLAVRYLVPQLETAPGSISGAVPGDGPPFWPPAVSDQRVVVRVTNTGSQPWPDDLRLAGAWQASDQPYLRVPPDGLEDVLPAGSALPGLQPGESIDVELELPAAGTEPGLYWISLEGDEGSFTERGSPPLQLATGR